jgi:hypothetical protein
MNFEKMNDEEFVEIAQKYVTACVKQESYKDPEFTKVFEEVMQEIRKRSIAINFV